ncbi:hypothetical protein MSIMFI_05483 [Mycobacterium simulans]|nr:hypothetical protein MSIMFI_05483 [Mycobacterium simulans]
MKPVAGKITFSRMRWPVSQACVLAESRPLITIWS